MDFDLMYITNRQVNWNKKLSYLKNMMASYLVILSIVQQKTKVGYMLYQFSGIVQLLQH
jgi:hypothetical protein